MCGCRYDSYVPYVILRRSTSAFDTVDSERHGKPPMLYYRETQVHTTLSTVNRTGKPPMLFYGEAQARMTPSTVNGTGKPPMLYYREAQVHTTPLTVNGTGNEREFVMSHGPLCAAAPYRLSKNANEIVSNSTASPNQMD